MKNNRKKHLDRIYSLSQLTNSISLQNNQSKKSTIPPISINLSGLSNA